MNRIIFAALIMLTFITPVMAETYLVTIKKKQDTKKNVSWNLFDHMLMKKKFSMMDQWLALHSSYPWFEFMLGGNLANYKLTTDTYGVKESKNHHSKSLSGSMNVKILGIGGEYENGPEPLHTRSIYASLRLFGMAVQGTNLTFIYGYRTLAYNNDTYRNRFWGGAASIYLFRYFGFDGLYRYYIPRGSRNASYNKGTYWEYGTFIDISFLRLYASLYTEDLEGRDTTGIIKHLRSGHKLGLKLFF